MKHLILEDSKPACDDNVQDCSFGDGRTRWSVSPFAALGLLVPLLVWAITQIYSSQIEGDAFGSLEITARLKAQQVESWLAERRSEGKVLAVDTELIERVAGIRRTNDSGQRALLRQGIDILRQSHGYAAAYLLDPQGEVLLALGAENKISAQTKALLPGVFASGEVTQSALYLDSPEGLTSLDFVVPLRRTVAGYRQAVAALVLHAESDQSLFPLILAWPTSSHSGEALLVQGEGDSVLYLNPLRHVDHAALKLKRPLGSPLLPAAIAIRSGQAGTVRGRDYHGIDVLAAYRPIAGTDWYLVAKLDYEEAMAPLWKLATWVGLVALIATIAIGLLLHRFWHQQKSLHRLAARTEQEKSLRESEVRFRAVTETARDAIVTISTDGNIVAWNSAATRLFGFATHEIIGQSLTQIIPARFHPQAMDDFWRLMNGDPEHRDGGITELIGQRKDGSEFYLERSVALWETATGRFYTSTMRDISERKLQEVQTRQLLAENETILCNALVGIVYLKQRRIVSSNRRLEEIFQYDPGELIGLSSEVFYDTHENFLAIGERAYPPLAEQKTYSEELMLRRKDGSLFWGAINGCAIDSAHPHEGSIWVYADISERRRAERQLEEQQAQLEDLVLQRTAELREALEAANLADRAKDEFLANITHELRTPLSAVIGFSSLARPFCTDARQRDYLDKVNTAGKTLSGIIDDLLDLSKIVVGRMEFEATPFSLRQMVMRSSSVISFKAQEKGLALVEIVDDEVPDLLLGDSLRVEQILLNLLSNAVKFTTEGRVELRIGLQAREAQRVCLNIEVEDTGVGLRVEEIARMFKPFSQADASITRKFGGTGLGLAICKRLAELMDGEIGVTSREGCGSIFRVKLWLALGGADARPYAAEREQESAPIRYHDARVLVVDDQPFNRDIVQGLLAVVGITPHLACNGQEALDILSASSLSFDLVMMDIQMPVMDGLTATRVIRKLNGFAQLPIVAMTAHTMVHEKMKGVEAGMNDLIGKPFDEASFYRVLAKWIPLDKQRQQHSAAARPVAANGLPSLHGVDTRAGLALLLGDEARYRYWLNDFVLAAPAATRQIRQALAARERESASMAAHSLKGRVGLLGMNDLYASAAALETAIDAATPSDELLRELEQGIAAMCVEIQRGVGLANSAGPATEPRWGAIENKQEYDSDSEINPEINPKNALIHKLIDKLPPGLPSASVMRLIARLQAGDGDCDVFAAECLADPENTDWVPHLRQALLHIQSFDFATAGRLLADGRQAQTLDS